MDKTNSVTTLNEILPNLQVNLIEAHYTQCWPEWRELDYVPTYNKLYFICDGEGWLKIKGQEFTPKPGQLCLIPAYTRQSYSSISDRPFLKYWCHFTADIGHLDLFQWLEVPFCMNVTDKPRTTELFKDLVSCYQDTAFSARFREKAVLLELLAYITKNTTVKIVSRQSDDMDRLTHIKQYVEDQLQNSITLEDIANQVHLHPNYLIKYFNKHLGTIPLKYIKRKRMERARFLLRTTTFSIKEIANQTGFEDANHFAKVFRSETSFSPTAYRANF